MAHDDLSKLRKKNKFVFEVRYPAKTSIIDNRGSVIDILIKEFQNKTSRWRLDTVKVNVMDDPDNPKKIFTVDQHSGNMQYEDVSTLQEFIDDARKFNHKLFEIFNNSIPKVNRVGVRFMSVYTIDKLKNFNDVHNKINDIFLNKSLSFASKPTDISIIYKFKNSTVRIGPVLKTEEHIVNTYQETNNVPEYGLFLDIDCFATNIQTENINKLIELFNNVSNATIELEKEIISKFLD